MTLLHMKPDVRQINDNPTIKRKLQLNSGLENIVPKYNYVIITCMSKV